MLGRRDTIGMRGRLGVCHQTAYGDIVPEIDRGHEGTDVSVVVFGVVACVVTAISLRPVVSRLDRAGVVDLPCSRSLHAAPTVSGAGIAVLIGLLAAAAAAIPSSDDRVALAGFMTVVLLFALLGLSDDVEERSIPVRLFAQVVLAVLAAAVLPSGGVGPILFVVVVTLWVVGFVNLVNFMDGINGITAATAAVVAGSFAASSVRVDDELSLVLAVMVLGASVGFLPFNFPAPRAFLGDCGSYLFGAALGLLAVRLLVSGSPTFEVAAPLFLYLADGIFTLGRRILAGDTWWRPHRTHVYQRLAEATGHTRTTLVVAVLTAVLALIGHITALAGGFPASAMGVCAATGTVLIYLSIPHLQVPSLRSRRNRRAGAGTRSRAGVTSSDHDEERRLQPRRETPRKAATPGRKKPIV